MNYIKLLCVCASVVASWVCEAKDVTGTIVDEVGQPLPFVNVVLHSDTTFVTGTVTGDGGEFHFENVDSTATDVKISMIGYDELVRDLPKDGNLGTICLNPTSLHLGEVEVKASLPITRIHGNAIITKVENSVLATTGTANNVLKNVPMVTGANGSYSVFGRGEAIIYINGRLVRNPSDIGQLASSDIKDVQVITNPGAQYGADVNAVIKIVTKKHVGEGFGLSLYSDNIYNKQFTTTEQLDLKYRAGGVEVFATGVFSHGKSPHDEYIVSAARGASRQQTNSDASVITTKTAVSGKIGFSYQPNDNHSIGAYYKNYYDRGHQHGHYLNVISENGGLAEASISDLDGSFKGLPSNSVNIYYVGQVGKFNFDFNGDYFQTKDKEQTHQYEQNLLSANRHVTTINTIRNRLLAEKASISYQLPNGSILIGEEYTNSRSRDDFCNPEAILTSEETDVHESNTGIFAQANFTFGKFNVSAGIRYEHVESNYFLDGTRIDSQSKQYDNVFPSASISYSPGDFRFSLAYSSHTVRPSYQNLSGNYFYLNSVLYAHGNPYLVPSKRHDISAQASWKYITLSAQYSFTKDAIIQVYEPYEGNERINVFTLTNIPSHKYASFYVNTAPEFGIYHPSLSLGVQKQWFGIEYLGQHRVMNKPMFTIQMNNTLALHHDWYVEAMFWWRSHGDWKNWAYTHTLSVVNLRVYKMFLDKSLTVYLGVNDIFNGQIYKANLYSDKVMMQSCVNNHGRSVELTLRYNFNASKNRYKGTGAGQAEKSRF